MTSEIACHRQLTGKRGSFESRASIWVLIWSAVFVLANVSLYGIYLARGLRLNFFSGERPWDVTAGQMIPEGVMRGAFEALC
jgi:hypothetical protein